jgi:hypothetical protein
MAKGQKFQETSAWACDDIKPLSGGYAEHNYRSCSNQLLWHFSKLPDVASEMGSLSRNAVLVLSWLWGAISEGEMNLGSVPGAIAT